MKSALEKMKEREKHQKILQEQSELKIQVTKKLPKLPTSQTSDQKTIKVPSFAIKIDGEKTTKNLLKLLDDNIKHLKYILADRYYMKQIEMLKQNKNLSIEMNQKVINLEEKISDTIKKLNRESNKVIKDIQNEMGSSSKKVFRSDFYSIHIHNKSKFLNNFIFHLQLDY